MDQLSTTRINGTAVGLLVGTVVGAIGALMLAPSSGSETRRRLGHVVDRIRPRGRENAHEHVARTR